MPPINNAQAAKLRDIKNLESLIEYLHEELDWPLDLENINDAYFDYDADEIGLDEDSAAKIKAIKQLRPLTNAQPWGIFFVEFNDKKLPIVALRRILRGLVVKRRATGADRQRWQTKDLLFVSAFGESGDRQITFAHFTDESEAGDLPTLRVLGWDAADTGFQLERTAAALHEHMRWPAVPIDAERWRSSWSAAFRLKVNQVINDSKSLAKLLAVLAARIRQRANAVLALETSKGPLRTMAKAFRDSLISDLSDDKFADMYAQTVTYGMFAARVGRQSGGLIADDLSSYVSTTSPFLKEMLGSFLDVSGRARARINRIDFDELGINELVEALRAAPIADIVAQFGNDRPDDDPVIHFYEDFLAAYDKALKVQRGVFYTPRPVVSYIVRSVHELLQSEFGLVDGLADTTTWGEMLKKHPTLTLPMRSDDQQEKETISPGEPFVQILDPATGTATFLIEVIDVIHKTMIAKWKAAGLNETKCNESWNEYVPRHLLPRLFGYELMMAPYAIAHMKLGLKLAETGYKFQSDARAQVYLTNSLEPALQQMPLIGFDALAHEAAAVNSIKLNKRFTVFVGNPPYSPSVTEPAWLMQQMSVWKQGLNETKSDLNREEWKFVRYMQMMCSRAGKGIVGLIVNRDFLDGIAKRRMREHLGEFFPHITIVDLNGDVKGNIADENVFDIEQGVAIALFSTEAKSRTHLITSRVGTRAEKCADLNAHIGIAKALVPIRAISPYFRWVIPSVNTPEGAEVEYANWIPIDRVFVKKSSGIETKNDTFCIAYSADEIWSRVKRLSTLSAADAIREFDISEGGWTVAAAQADLRQIGLSEARVKRILYKPFDWRFVYFTDRSNGFLGRPRYEVMRHMLSGRNVALIFNRQTVGDVVSQFGVTSDLMVKGTFYLGNKGNDVLAPLYIETDDLISSQDLGGRSNFTEVFMNRLGASCPALAVSADPLKVFHYIVGVFHSNNYRVRYAEFLKIDFPRLPLTTSLPLFNALASFGSELTSLQVLTSPKVDRKITEFVGSATSSAEKISWSDETVWIDRAKSVGFKGVPEAVWNFCIGGYQVCEKWLKDRKGQTLSAEDIAHYQKIVVAISETIRIMAEIDRVIDEYGGWPGAFITEPVDIEAEVIPLTTSEPAPLNAAPAKTRVARKTTGPDPMDLFTTAANDESGEIVRLAAESEKSYDVAPSRKSGEITANDAIGAFRECLSGGGRSRDDLIRDAAHHLGFGRTGSLIREALGGHIRAAARRGVVTKEGDLFVLAARSIDDFERGHLKDQFIAALAAESSGYVERADAIRAFARWLGYARTGDKIEANALSLINGLLREGRLEASGSMIRKAR